MSLQDLVVALFLIVLGVIVLLAVVTIATRRRMSSAAVEMDVLVLNQVRADLLEAVKEASRERGTRVALGDTGEAPVRPRHSATRS